MPTKTVKRVYIYHCINRSDVRGLTLESNGSNLPYDSFYQGWQFLNELEIDEASHVPLLTAEPNKVLYVLKEKGYCICV